MRNFLIAIQGQNRTGIVSQVTGLLYRSGVNLTDSFMTSLRSEFTMMMIVQLPEELNLTTFEAELESLSSHALGVFLRPILAQEAQHGNRESIPNYSISILGKDQTGMVFRFSELLAAQQVNITDLNTRLLDSGQTPLYAMLIEIHVPAQVPLQELKVAIQETAQELGIDAHFNPIEQLEF
jgi:glycine cleavage system transcriptional repressor